MLFLMQSSPLYIAPAQPIYREPEKVIDTSDDEFLMAWFTYMQRYYAKSVE